MTTIHKRLTVGDLIARLAEMPDHWLVGVGRNGTLASEVVLSTPTTNNDGVSVVVK